MVIISEEDIVEYALLRGYLLCITCISAPWCRFGDLSVVLRFKQSNALKFRLVGFWQHNFLKNLRVSDVCSSSHFHMPAIIPKLQFMC